MFFIDPLYLIMMGPMLLLAIYAQIRVKSAYAQYSRVGTSRGLTGAEAAHRILRDAGVNDVEVEVTEGWLSDHYDPRSRVLRLSPNVFSGRSVASVGIAAHEAGHAIQHAEGYVPMALRSFIVPVASVGSNLAVPLIFIGFIFGLLGLVKAGIVLFSVMVLFQIVTLPVEFNASKRAKLALADSGIVTNEQEAHGVRAVLNAAAMTYVAAALTVLMQLLYFALRAGLLGGRDD